MTDEANEAAMQELRNMFVSHIGEAKGEQESFLLEEESTDDIPPSLLSYFETSHSRAAVCEKLILGDLEDFTASSEDMTNLPVELDEDMMEQNIQVISETEKDNNTSTDAHLLAAPTEMEELFSHNGAVYLKGEGEPKTDEHMESENHLTSVRIPKTALEERDREESSEYARRQREKLHVEEMNNEERRRRRENDFEEELKKIIETEKLHQMELTLMEKRAQEKLKEELLLQQELICNFQKQMETDRRMREDEWKRIKEEEKKRRKENKEKRKREDQGRLKRQKEKVEMDMQREREQEETRKKKEEEDKEDRLKEEKEKRNKEEEQMKNEEEEAKRRGEKDKKKKREEQARNTLEKAMRKEEEESEIKERNTEIRHKEEEKMRQMEEGENEEMLTERGNNKERNKDEEIRTRGEEKKTDVEEHKMEVDKSIKYEEEKKEVMENKTKEDNVKGEHVRMQQEELRKAEERSKAEVEKLIDGQMRKKENKNSEDRLKLKKDQEKSQHSMENKDIKKEEEKITNEKKLRKKQEEAVMRQKEQICGKIETGSVTEKDGSKTYGSENTKEEEKRYVEMDEGGINIEGDMGQINETLRETKENIKADKRHNEEEESKIIRLWEDRLKRVMEAQKEKCENSSMNIENERKNTDNSGHSQLEDSTTCVLPSPCALHSVSTVSPSSTQTLQKHYLEKMYVSKTLDRQDAVAQPFTSSGSLPVCLPEHTEQKRLSWMKDCVPWSKLSLQNKRKQKGSAGSRRLPRRPAEASSLPPLCSDTLLQSTAQKSLQEATTLTLEDSAACNLSTLFQCTHLRSLTLRRCGLKSLEGISQLQQLCYIDVEENDISFVDCENMTSLRVLRLAHNKLTSIHGLGGADNLDVLELSHNSITRIAGLESVRRLQRLSVDHNQLISTKGLRDVYTLLHLNCSHNHLASVEGLENSPLLSTLDLRANSLNEPPNLNNHVLLRELHLDDNSISSLQALTACWLPLMQHLSVAQNRITHLPSMSDFVSLANLDLRFNCMSELQIVCKSLEGCHFLQDIYLTGNPLQQESGWRSTLQKALPDLRSIDGQEADSFLPPPAGQQISLTSLSFLTFCQAQLQQIRDLQEQHSKELSKVSSSLDAVESSCRHFTENLKMAEDQRLAHEFGDTVSAGQTGLEETVESTSAEKFTEHSQTQSTEKHSPVIPSLPDVRCSLWTLEEKSCAESWRQTSDTVTVDPKTDLLSQLTNRRKSSLNFKMAALDLKNAAAVVIQQQWRKYRQKCGNIIDPPVAKKGGGRGGDGANLDSGSWDINSSAVDQHNAAAVIQAFWRGFTLRRRLASALASVMCPSTREDDTLDEVDVDEFVFDEAGLEKLWKLRLPEESPFRQDSMSEQSLSLKLPVSFSERSHLSLTPLLVWRPREAWVDGEQVECAGHRTTPESSNRKSPALTFELSGASERSEKLLEEWGFTNSHTALLMLKRAQKMTSKQHQQKNHRDPSDRLALFRNCNYQLGPVEARNRPPPHSRNYTKVCKAELGIQQAEKTERAQQCDRLSESVHFLPEISSEILNGGRVQLVADPAYTEQRHASGLRASSGSAGLHSKQSNYPNRISSGHARKDVPSPKQVTSAPSKRERISFRDNPVQQSGGWGGGKKRDKVYK